MCPLGMIARLFFGGVLLIQRGIFGTIINTHALSDGICHKDELRIEISVECDIKSFKIDLVTESTDNTLLQCQNSLFSSSCIKDKSFQTSHNNNTGIFIMNTTFDHTKLAGYTLWVNYICRNNKTVGDKVVLKPCLSGFKTTAYHNDTHITISCEHDSFRFSRTGMRIVDKNDLAHCRWNQTNQTNECDVGVPLANGTKITTPYTQGMNITCKFDEQSVEIVPQQQTTTATTTAATTTTTKSPAASPSNQSGDSGQAKPTCCVSTISILSILSFIHRDIFI